MSNELDFKLSSDDTPEQPIRITQEAFDTAFGAVKGYVDRSFDAYDETLAALERRLAELEQKGR